MMGNASRVSLFSAALLGLCSTSFAGASVYVRADDWMCDTPAALQSTAVGRHGAPGNCTSTFGKWAAVTLLHLDQRRQIAWVCQNLDLDLTGRSPSLYFSCKYVRVSALVGTDGLRLAAQKLERIKAASTMDDVMKMRPPLPGCALDPDTPHC